MCSAGPTVVGGVLTAVLLTPTLPAPHAQSQGGHVAPGAQLGQAHVQVRAAAVTRHASARAAGARSRTCTGNRSRRARTPGSRRCTSLLRRRCRAAGFEQSHWTAGQSAFAGQTTGWTQVQPPPEASRSVTVTTGVAGLPGRAKVDRLRRGPQARPGTARVGFAAGRGRPTWRTDRASRRRRRDRRRPAGSRTSRRATHSRRRPCTRTGWRSRRTHRSRTSRARRGCWPARSSRRQSATARIPARLIVGRTPGQDRGHGDSARTRRPPNARPLKNLIRTGSSSSESAADGERGTAAVEQRGRDHHAARTMEELRDGDARRRSDDRADGHVARVVAIGGDAQIRLAAASAIPAPQIHGASR